MVHYKDGGDRSGNPEPRESSKERQVEWEKDLDWGKRGKKIKAEAERLKCERAFQVMAAMMNVMDHATNPYAIFPELTPEERQKTRKKYIGDYTYDEITERAWEEIQGQYTPLDLPNLPKGSDWARAISVFHAAIQPGEGINGVLDVDPPERDEGGGDQHWQRFAAWCTTKRLDPYGLWEVAQELKTKHKIKPSERDELKAELEKLTTAQLDQIILAGFKNENDLKIWNPPAWDHGYENYGYKTLAGSQKDLSPEGKKAAQAAADVVAKKARDTYLADTYGLKITKDGHVLSINNKYPIRWEQNRRRKIQRRGDFNPRYDTPEYETVQIDYIQVGTERKYITDILSEADQIQYATIDAEIKRGLESAVRILPASAAFGHTPTAAIIARQGTKGDKTIGFGFHPVSPEMVAMIAGPDQLHALPTELRLSKETGGIVAVKKKSLTSPEGAVLTTDVKETRSPEAVRLFAKKLADWQYGGLTDHLKFVFRNYMLIDEEQIAQWKARSQERLQTNFNLEDWYYKKLTDLGNIASIAEAQTHAAELTLAIEDVFAEQKELLAEVEHDYPAGLNLDVVNLPIHYHYISEERAERGSGPAGLSARIKIKGRHEQKQIDAILALPSYLTPSVGNAGQTIPIRFDPWYWDENKDAGSLARLQELLDSDNRAKAWEAYPDKNKRWEKTISIEDDLPMASEVVTEPIEPYYTCKNNELLFPTPGLTKADQQKDDKCLLVYALFRTAAEAATSTKGVEHWYKQDQEKHFRIKAITPEQKQAVANKTTELRKIIENTDPHNPYLEFKPHHHHTNKDMALRELDDVGQILARGELPTAQTKLQEIEKQIAETITEPWNLLQEVVRLAKQLVEARHWQAHKYKDYLDIATLEKSPDGLPRIVKLKKIITELQQLLRPQGAGANPARSNYRDTYEAWKAEGKRLKDLSPEQLQVETDNRREEIGELIVDINRQLHRPLHSSRDRDQIETIQTRLQDFKREYQKILRKPLIVDTVYELDKLITDMNKFKAETIRTIDRIARA